MDASDIVMLAAFIFAVIIVIITIKKSYFTVKTNHSAVVMRFGKFIRVAQPGLNFRIPYADDFVDVSLATYQLDAKIETKTKDNVFVELPVSVQFRIIDKPDCIRDAYFKPTNIKAQIESYLYNILLAHIPETTLDDVFLNQPAISRRATTELSEEMLAFGYEIVKVLITDIIPPEGVKDSMNRINSETRNAVANKAQGDADYILVTRQAEAQAEVMRQNGLGIAAERNAIADGLAAAIEKVAEGAEIDHKSALFSLLFTNYTAMMKEVGSSKNSTMVFMPSGPESVLNFEAMMQTALLSSVAKKLE